MNKRERVLEVINGGAVSDYLPAAFFLHFDPAYHQGAAAIDKHLEFFRYTDMDFVKIQYEQTPPPSPSVRAPTDWANAPRYGQDFFEPTVNVVKGLVQAAGKQALVVLTLYSPLMWAGYLVGNSKLDEHLKQDPEAVSKGLEIMTENVLTLARLCKQAGLDGFYASSQGGEAERFGGTDIFDKYIKPTDLAVWDEIKSCRFNILHICESEGRYDDLTPFLDYPGHVVNCSLNVGAHTLTPQAVSDLFGRPFMGGMARRGVISTGSEQEIRQAAQAVLAKAPGQFILAADCTVPSTTPWNNLKTAINTAHNPRK